MIGKNFTGFTILLLLGLSISAYAQDFARIQSIKKKIRESGENINRFNYLGDLAFEYRFANPDSTIYYCKLAQQLSDKLELESGAARLVNYIGVAYNYKGDRLTAYETFMKAMAVAQSQHDTLQIAYANNNLGRIFFDQGLLSRAYSHFAKGVSLFEALRDSAGMTYGYQGLAGLYSTQRDFKKAEEYFIKALNMRLKLSNTRDIMSAWVYLGQHYSEFGYYDKATSCYLKADSGYSTTKDAINLAEVRIFLAENYVAANKLKEAQEVFDKGYGVINKSSQIRFQPRLLLTLGKIEYLHENFASAEKHFKACLEAARKVKDLSFQMEAHLYLSKVATKQFKSVEHLKNFNEYLIIKDSLKDLEVARQVERHHFELQIEKKDQENMVLKATQERNEAIIVQQRYQNIILVVVALSMLGLGGIVWANSRKRQEANVLLARKNNEIEGQRFEILRQNEELAKRNQRLSDYNHEKDTLMSIVAHDLKSPLNRIRGLIQVMRLEGGMDENRLKLLKMIEDSTLSGIDLITDLLDVHEIEENPNVVVVPIDVKGFLQQRVESFRSVATAKNIEIKLHIGEVGTTQSDIEYLNRILDNLLSNAIKFSPKGSTVEVDSGKENGSLWFSVKDQGPGFQEFEKKLLYQKFKRLSARPTGGESSNGLGLAIVKTLIDRLKGEITLKSEQNKGSEFIVRIPD